MGLDKTSLPERLVRLMPANDRKRFGLTKMFSDSATSENIFVNPAKTKAKTGGTRYSLPVVLAWFDECGLPTPIPEYRFDPDRKWRFDFAFLPYDNLMRLAVEVQGGLFSAGAHVRGAALLREYAKLNRAAEIGWRILFVTPDQLCLTETADMIRRALSMCPDGKAALSIGRRPN